MKKCIVSVRYGGPTLESIVWFDKVCEGAAETYETVKKIIEANKLNYPDQKRTKEDYFDHVARIFAGALNSTENHIFKITKVDD